MNGNLLKLMDADTGETSMDVVKVPEGYSFQIGLGEDFFSCIVKRESAGDLRAFLALSGDAYKLMQYQDATTGDIEWVWNSRDGVTPFMIHSLKGNEASHIRWNEDVYDPYRVPALGDRVFVDFTEEAARPEAVKYVERWWDAPSMPMRDRWPSKELAVEEFVVQWVSDWGGHAPHLATVTPALRAIFEKRAENKHP
jgi:hypothetical protein